jgi:hypothetical protein
MIRDDIIRMAREAGWQEDMFGIGIWDSQELNVFAKLVAAAEREECASIEVKIMVPERDYADLSPKEIYEEALIDATLAFRAAIRAREQS